MIACVVRSPYRHHRRDRVLENKLFLIVGFKDQRIFIEAFDAAGKFHAAQQVNGYNALLFARIV